jgi:Domain of unknown function (DUF4252)
MKLTVVVLAVLIAVSAVKNSEAQQQQNLWMPQGIGILQQSASSKSEFTFDHSMLVLASKLDADNEDLRRVIAGVSGISVHRYHFPGSWQYDSGALSSVNEEYRAAGWKRVLNKHDKNEGLSATDLWVRLENNAISNIAILLARPNEVNFIVVSGSISPVDLSHLGGHFGIPKVEGGVVVSNNGERPD